MTGLGLSCAELLELLQAVARQAGEGPTKLLGREPLAQAGLVIFWQEPHVGSEVEVAHSTGYCGLELPNHAFGRDLFDDFGVSRKFSSCGAADDIPERTIHESRTSPDAARSHELAVDANGVSVLADGLCRREVAEQGEEASHAAIFGLAVEASHAIADQLTAAGGIAHGEGEFVFVSEDGACVVGGVGAVMREAGPAALGEDVFVDVGLNPSGVTIFPVLIPLLSFGPDLSLCGVRGVERDRGHGAERVGGEGTCREPLSAARLGSPKSCQGGAALQGSTGRDCTKL